MATEATPDTPPTTGSHPTTIIGANRVIKIEVWLRSAALVVLAVGLVLLSITVAFLARELAQAQAQLDCATSSAVRMDVVDSEISYHGWLGLAAIARNDDEEATRQIQQMAALFPERERAVEERRNVVNVCQ